MDWSSKAENGVWVAMLDWRSSLSCSFVIGLIRSSSWCCVHASCWFSFLGLSRHLLNSWLVSYSLPCESLYHDHQQGMRLLESPCYFWHRLMFYAEFGGLRSFSSRTLSATSSASLAFPLSYSLPNLMVPPRNCRSWFRYSGWHTLPPLPRALAVRPRPLISGAWYYCSIAIRIDGLFLVAAWRVILAEFTHDGGYRLLPLVDSGSCW